MSYLQCPTCYLEKYGLPGEHCQFCSTLMHIVRENKKLDIIREEARNIPINNQNVVDSLIDIFEDE